MTGRIGLAKEALVGERGSHRRDLLLLLLSLPAHGAQGRAQRLQLAGAQYLTGSSGAVASHAADRVGLAAAGATEAAVAAAKPISAAEILAKT